MSLLARLNIDRFLLYLVCTVVLASLLPISGRYAEWFSIATTIAIGMLFFLHGARLSPRTVVKGMAHWRLHLVIFLTTFALFPILGLIIGLLPPTLLSPALYTGILFLCVLPSTVQSSIAFTSIGGGNVAAAICSATASNILGMFITPILLGLVLSVNADGGAGPSLGPSVIFSCSCWPRFYWASSCNPGSGSGFASTRRHWPSWIAARF
ncbi:bile acid:sodium symporter [Kushneria konosiri]|uniref:bile acid:sodium symporter n=1 Tax=Kushneria konosiri TaxID=698828 RepID=UPI00202B3443|nr:bile acid:sodium symporter [Kushneria konosiri]